MAAELLGKFAALKQETDFELTKDNRNGTVGMHLVKAGEKF
jgi:hypothetical protein